MTDFHSYCHSTGGHIYHVDKCAGTLIIQPLAGYRPPNRREGEAAARMIGAFNHTPATYIVKKIKLPEAASADGHAS